MKALLIVAVLAQEKVELSWKLTDGRAFSMSWKTKMKMEISSNTETAPKTDFTLEFGGTLRVTKGGEKAECEFLFTRFLMKGAQSGREVDFLIEDGEVKRATGSPDNGKQMKTELLKPMKLRLTAQGEYEPAGSHAFQGFFSGNSDFFGPSLPTRAVGVGDSWDGTLKAGQADKPVTVLYKLGAFEKGTASILLDETKTVDQGAVRLQYRIKTASSFHGESGYCAKSKMEITFDGAGNEERGEKVSGETTVEFEASPVK